MPRKGYGEEGRWGSKAEALKGVPKAESEEYGKDGKNCDRCGRSNHRTDSCFATTTRAGTTIPAAPWKASAGTSRGPKRKRDQEEDERPLPKRQNKDLPKDPDSDMREAAAVSALWQDSDSEDFP
jgi:hypothetical protein